MRTLYHTCDEGTRPAKPWLSWIKREVTGTMMPVDTSVDGTQG